MESVYVHTKILKGSGVSMILPPLNLSAPH